MLVLGLTTTIKICHMKHYNTDLRDASVRINYKHDRTSQSFVLNLKFIIKTILLNYKTSSLFI